MTSPTQKGEREEALELAASIMRYRERSGYATFAMTTDEKLSAALLSSSKAEGKMREALMQARQELWNALIHDMSKAEFNKEVEYIDAALKEPK